MTLFGGDWCLNAVINLKAETQSLHHSVRIADFLKETYPTE